MKLVYFHGFASSGASGTAQLLAKLFPSGEVIAPDIPLDPDEALPFLTELVKKEQPDIIIGTSMGGMYAQQMRGVLRICVNPAFQMSSLSKVLHTGTFKWLNGRKNVSSPCSWVVIATSNRSTAKYTKKRLLNRKQNSFGSRSYIYCLFALSTD